MKRANVVIYIHIRVALLPSSTAPVLLPLIFLSSTRGQRLKAEYAAVWETEKPRNELPSEESKQINSLSWPHLVQNILANDQALPYEGSSRKRREPRRTYPIPNHGKTLPLL